MLDFDASGGMSTVYGNYTIGVQRGTDGSGLVGLGIEGFDPDWSPAATPATAARR